MRRIVINGAGIGGLALAAGLARRVADGAELDVRIAERAPGLRAAGAGIVLAPNAQRALRAVGVTPVGKPFEAFRLANARGEMLAKAPVAADAEPSLAVHRQRLLEDLARAVPADWIRFSTAVVGVQDGAAVTDSGERWEADLLVGADGVGSAVRASLNGGQLEDAGYLCWRTLVSAVPGTPHTPVELWGVGTRAGIVPLPGGQVYVYLCATHAGEGPEPDVQAVIRGFGGVVENLLSCGPRWRVDRIAEHAEHVWRRGRVVLLGDASHALTPNMGQGAAMALEDAATLAPALSAESLDEALDSWVEARRSRVRWVAQRSRTLGRVGQWTSPWACALRNWMLWAAPKSASASTGRRLASWHPDGLVAR